MSDISAISGSSGDRIDHPSGGGAGDRAAIRSVGGVPARPSDRVELSDRARLLGKLAALPEVRQDLIAHAKRAIATGSYDRDEVLERTAEGLAQDLDVQA